MIRNEYKKFNFRCSNTKLKRERRQYRKDMLSFVHNKQVCKEGVRHGLEEDITTEMGQILAEAKPVIYGIKCYKKKQSKKKESKKEAL